MNYLFGCLIACIAYSTSLLCMDKDPEIKVPELKQVRSLKDSLIDKIIEQGISVPENTIDDLKMVIKKKMLGDHQKIDFINILNKLDISKEKQASLPAQEFIVALSPNGKRLLVHHSEDMSFAVYHTNGEKILSIAPHCDCMTPPIYAFDEDGTCLALAAFCSKTHTTLLEIVNLEAQDMQTIPLGPAMVESLVINAKRSLIGRAGGCSSCIQLYERENKTAGFKEAIGFGAGHLIAFNHAGTRLAAINHGELIVYDISDLSSINELFRLNGLQIPILRFCKSTDKILLPMPILHGIPNQKSVIAEGYAQSVISVSLSEGTILPSVALSDNGGKMVSLVNGVPRFIYMVEDEQKQLELLTQEEKFIVARLHDDDTALTACTHHDIYSYDLNTLKAFEDRFAKSIDKMKVDDVPVALALQEMKAQEYKNCAQGTAANHESALVNHEINRLLFGPEKTGSKSLMKRLEIPILGAFGLLFAFCVCSK